MKFRKIPHTKLKTSVIALGSGALHRSGDKKEQHRIIRAAIDLGINHFDFSYNYDEGKVERIAGECLSELPRQNLILASKAFFTLPEDKRKPGLTRENITVSVDHSLRKLQTDYLDIFYCHRFDLETPMSESIGCIAELISAGTIRYWGVSHWPITAILLADQLCQTRGWPRPVVSQGPLSLIADGCSSIAEKKDELLVSAVAYSPLSGGILSGKYNDSFRLKKDLKPSKKYSFNPAAVAHHRQHLKKFASLCEKFHVTCSQAATMWTLRQSVASCVVAGVTSTEQLEENVASLYRRLPKDFWDDLALIF